VALCPVNCIPLHPDFVESPAQLHAKYHLLTQAPEVAGAAVASRPAATSKSPTGR